MMRVCLLTSLVLSLTSFSAVQAQTKADIGGSGPPALKTLATKVPEKKRAVTVVDSGPATGGGPLGVDQLEKMLKEMGYEAKVTPLGSSGKRFEVEEGGWPLSVNFSPDLSILWITCGLAKLPNPASAPSDKLLKLLDFNNNPSATFYYDSENQIIGIQKALPNTNITIGMLRKSLGGVARMMTASYDTWKPENFK